MSEHGSAASSLQRGVKKQEVLEEWTVRTVLKMREHRHTTMQIRPSSGALQRKFRQRVHEMGLSPGVNARRMHRHTATNYEK
eukprot:6195190-Pleurochrysis_carterae.AAC.1